MAALAHVFPGHTEQIERLRSCDLVFAGICQDYELLTGLMPMDCEDPTFADYRESLSGLENEICAYLGLPPRHPPHSGLPTAGAPANRKT